jgi:hypothetical protein
MIADSLCDNCDEKKFGGGKLASPAQHRWNKSWLGEAFQENRSGLAALLRPYSAR